MGTCWARCVRARSGGARSPASSSPKKQTRSNFRARVETPSLAQPHHTQFGGEHASPLGNRRPRCYPHDPAHGYRFRIMRAGGDYLVAEILCVVGQSIVGGPSILRCT